MKITKSSLRELVKEAILESAASAPEKEPIVDQIINQMKVSGVISRDGVSRGLIDQVDNYDEFEDLIRFIVNATGLPNDNSQLYVVLKKISEDFKNDPDGAANLSSFNLGI